MDADVTLAPDDGEGGEDEIRLEIEGPDAGRMIGKRGLVLEAIQYLTSRVAHRPGEPRKHVARRTPRATARVTRTSSPRWARKLGDRVAAEGKVITFDPMSARDRRIVHKALQDVAGVRHREQRRRAGTAGCRSSRSAPPRPEGSGVSMKDGRYTNLDGTTPDKGFGAIFKWQVTDRLSGKRPRGVPAAPTPLRPNDGAALLPADAAPDLDRARELRPAARRQAAGDRSGLGKCAGRDQAAGATGRGVARAAAGGRGQRLAQPLRPPQTCRP